MNTKQLNILLADDDIDDRQLFKEALYEILPSAQLATVNDGVQLMEDLSDIGAQDLAPLPDIIFLDINMPRKNGTECVREIKKDEKLKTIPIVMFSTSNEWDTINSLFKSGVHVYIHKPSDFAQLKQVIQHALPIAEETTAAKKPLKYILNAANNDRPK